MFLMLFLLNRPTININRPTGPWALSSIWNTRRVTNESSGSWIVIPVNRQTRKSPILWRFTNETPSPAGLYFRPVYAAGYIPDTAQEYYIE